MKNIIAILTGIGLLIAIYLFLSNGDKTVKIIDVIASNTTTGIKTLQGRG
jgi:hypothetical protein